MTSYDKYHWPCDDCGETLDYTKSFKDLQTGKHYCLRCFKKIYPNYITNEEKRTGARGSLSKD